MENTLMQEVVIKIEVVAGYLKGLVNGVAKSPNDGQSIIATFDIGEAHRFESNSTELSNATAVLDENGYTYSLVSKGV